MSVNYKVPPTGQYNATPPTLANGDVIAPQVDSTGKLMVNAEVTANISGAQEVIISAADDSIKIGDGSGHFLAINVDGSINATTTPAAGGATSANQTNGSQKTQIVDGSGNVIGSTANALNASITNVTLAVTQSGAWNVVNVSGTVSLPTGASTSALQGTGNTSLASIDTKTPALVSGRVPVDGSGVTQPIKAASGTATGTGQNVNDVLISVDTLGYTSGYLHIGHVSGSTSEMDLAFEFSNDNATWFAGVGITDPISTNGTPPFLFADIETFDSFSNTFAGPFDYRVPFTSRYFRVRVRTVHLPSSAILSATLTYFAESVTPPVQNVTAQILDQFGNNFCNFGPAPQAQSLSVSIASDQTAVPVSGTFFQATQPVSIASMPSTPVTGPLTDTQLRASAVPMSLASLPALAGGTALIGKVGIDQTTPGTTNGVQVNAALPAGTNVIGHVIVDTAPTTAVTGPLTDTQLRASSVPVSLAAETTKVIGTVNVASGQTIGLAAGSQVIGHVIVDTAPTTAITAASLPLPTLAATSTIQTNASQKTQIVDGSGNVIASTSNALNTNLTNTSIAITAAALPLPSLASTSTLQTSGNASLSSLDTKTPSLGQAAMAASRPVVIASDQSSVPVTVGNFPASVEIANDAGNAIPISAAALPLPSNAAQETGGALAQNTLDNTNMRETLQEMIIELRAIRLAMVALVTEGQRNVPEDFDPLVQNFSGTLQ